MIELERHGVAQQYAADWFETGVKLGLNDFPNVLENITESSLENDRLCFHEVLYKWLKLFPDATWRSLEVALTNVKREKLHLDPVTDVNISKCACDISSFVSDNTYLIQNSQAVKKVCGPQKGYGEKRCEIQGGGQEMAVMVG